MTTRISHDLTYDAPAAEVAAMLGDPDFRREVCRAQHAESVEVEVDTTHSAGRRVRVDQSQQTRGLPSYAARIVGDRIRIVREETWTSAEHAELTLAIPGKPGDIAGTVDLRESGGGTTQTVDLRATVSIPLVGGKVEALVASLLASYFRAENEVGRSYLSR